MSDEAPKLPRVRLDLAKLASNVAYLPSWDRPSEAEMRLALEMRGWVEGEDGWWEAPSEFEMRLTVYAVTEREG